MQKPYLNAGCGRIVLPTARPAHHALIDDAIYAYPLWVNADRNAAPGVDQVVDLFRYPWPFEDNSFDGALLAHLCEHIPHEIRINHVSMLDDEVGGAASAGVIGAERRARLMDCQDGWYAFFAELYRVLTPGAIAHILSPYAWSEGAVGDPTHTRLLTPGTFVHSMQPDPDAPFAYAVGGLHFEPADAPRYNITPGFQHLIGQTELLNQAVNHQVNVVSEFSVKLRAVK